MTEPVLGENFERQAENKQSVFYPIATETKRKAQNYLQNLLVAHPSIWKDDETFFNDNVSGSNSQEKKSFVISIQQFLVNEGYMQSGSVDGVGGVQTKRAMRVYFNLQKFGLSKESFPESVAELKQQLSGLSKQAIIDIQKFLIQERFMTDQYISNSGKSFSNADGIVGGNTYEGLRNLVNENRLKKEVVVEAKKEEETLLNEIGLSFEQNLFQQATDRSDLLEERRQEYQEYKKGLVESLNGSNDINIPKKIAEVYGFKLDERDYSKNVNFKIFLNDLEASYNLPVNFLYTKMIIESQGIPTANSGSSKGLFQLKGSLYKESEKYILRNPILSAKEAARRSTPGSEFDPNSLQDIASIFAAYNGGTNIMYSPRPHDQEKKGLNQGKELTAQTLYEPQRRFAVISGKPNYKEGWITKGLPRESRRHALKALIVLQPERYLKIREEALKLSPITAEEDFEVVERRWKGTEEERGWKDNII